MLLTGTASGRWELVVGNSLSLLSSLLSLALSAGWVSSCVEEPDDWQLHMCLCNYGLANWQREERWDIVITDTPAQPLTHADGGRNRPLPKRRDEREERLSMYACVFVYQKK